jgi:hypothetical protein
MKRLGLTMLALCAASFAQDNLANWARYKVISVNTKATGANVAASVAKFPVLVRLNATNANDVFAGDKPAQAGGADIRFTNAAGVARPFQIESWDATAKTAAIWVLADSVKGNDSVATLRLYWGRMGVGSASNGATVFDTANGYRAVYHMSSGTSKTEPDATAMGNHMAASDSVSGSVPGDTIGAVGRARVFAGDSLTPAGRQYFVAPGTAGKAELNFGPNYPHTISAWVYARDLHKVYNQYGHGSSIFNKGDRQFAMQAYGDTANRLWEGALYANANNGWRQVKSKTKALTGGWYHLATTWTGGANGTDGTAKLYINGVLDSTIALAIGTGTSGNNLPHFTYNLYLGANPTGGSTSANPPGTTRDLADGTTSTPRFWNGYLDEIALARGTRSDEFVKLSYETQKASANAVVLGATQTQAVTATAVTNIHYQMQGTLNAPRDTIVTNVGVPVNLTLKYDGGPADSAKITTGTLPPGLTINTTTGAITGTPAVAFGPANQTLTVYFTGGTITRGLRFSAVAEKMSLTKYTPDTATYAVGVPVSNAPQFAVGGRAATKVTITPALPAGLKIDSVTGVISGIPTAAAAAANYAVKATNATDTSSVSIRLTVVAVASESYMSAWSVHKDIYLNTQPNGANVSGGVAKFPVLVRFDASFIGTGTAPLATGDDFRFTKSDDVSRLPHELESWNATTKVGAAWVLVDTIKGNDGTQKIRLHWGNASAPNVSSSASVFDTSAGFQAVYHMNGSVNEADATLNGFTALAASAPTSGNGAVGNARVLNGNGQFFTVPNSASGKLNFQQVDSYTLSSWINPSAITASTSGTGHKIIDKGDNQYVLATYGSSIEGRFWEITIRANDAWNQCIADGSFAGSTAVLASSSVGSWNHLVGTYTGGAVGSDVTQRLYYNGVLVNQCVISNTATTGRNENFNVHLGVQAEGTAPGTAFSRYWQGSLDETRLSNKARSADWIKLEYANQRATADQKLVAFTPPVSINGNNSALVAGGLGMTAKSLDNGVLFRLQGVNTGDKAVMSLVDMWGRTVFNGAFENGALSWNGRGNNGQGISAGVYVARVTVIDGQNKVRKVMEHKLPFTR